MNRNEEWNEILEIILNCAVEGHKSTKEGEYQHKRREAIDEVLTTNLSASEKTLVDECMFEIGLAAEHETRVVYQQGLKDCVWLLKNLGVLA